MKRLLILAVIATCQIGNDSAASTPTAFTAEYATSRNGTELGRTTIELRENADATWTLRTATVGTSGLARLAGLDVLEESTVRWRDGRPETIAYDFRQDVAMGNKRRHATFDWDTREVRMTEGSNSTRYALEPGTVDRHAVTLALVNDLARDATSYDYRVAMKDAIEDVRYSTCGETRVSVPAGAYDTLCLQRKREKRTSTSWFAKSIGWIPVQLEQVEKKGDTITLRLVSVRRADNPASAPRSD